MKNIFLFAWLLLFGITGNAQQVATNANVNLRSTPSVDGKVVYKVPKGTTVDLNGCQDKWCEVTVAGYSGYIARQYTSTATSNHTLQHKQVAHATGPINHYTNSRGNVVQSPTHYNAPPESATAQCMDGTYSFSQSRRGTCSHHGGVAKWLK